MMKIRRISTVCLMALAFVFAVSCGDAPRTNNEGQQQLFSPPAAYPSFSGARAFELLERQVAFGPRVPGSDAHDACLAYFVSFFDSLGIPTQEQYFTLRGYDNEKLELTNVIASLQPENPSRVLLCAHWDSRPWADAENDPDRALKAVPGANDGASGVAVLLHLAEVLREHPAPVGVDIILFDGEDYGREGDESMFLIGSRYYAATYEGKARTLFGVLLDLVGDRDARFPQEEFSRQYAGDILKMVWDAAATLGLSRFTQEEHSPILDDHVPLNTVAGIKTVDIIDASLVGHDTSSPRRQYWHTTRDLPDQCAPQPLQDVGTLLLYILHGIQQAPNT